MIAFLTGFFLIIAFLIIAALLGGFIGILTEDIRDEYRWKIQTALAILLIGSAWMWLAAGLTIINNEGKIRQVQLEIGKSRADAVRKCMAEKYGHTHIAFSVWENERGYRYVARNDDDFKECKYAQ